MDVIIQEFPRLLRKRLKNHLKKIILFGSRAREDFNDSSDYDFLVIVDKRNKVVEDAVLEAGAYLLKKYSELIAFLIWEENEWKFKKRFPIGLNIQKEGKEI